MNIFMKLMQTIKDGVVYQGVFVNDMPKEYAKFTVEYPDGSRYEGFLNTNWEMHGQGIYTDKKGVIYKGCFENGLFSTNRKFEILYPNEDVYEGFVNQNLQPHDEDGVYEFQNGKTYSGTFINGELQRNLPIGIRLSNGAFFKGIINENDEPHGKGTYTVSARNIIYTGEFENGLPKQNVIFTIKDNSSVFKGLIDKEFKKQCQHTMYRHDIEMVLIMKDDKIKACLNNKTQFEDKSWELDIIYNHDVIPISTKNLYPQMKKLEQECLTIPANVVKGNGLGQLTDNLTKTLTKKIKEKLNIEVNNINTNTANTNPISFINTVSFHDHVGFLLTNPNIPFYENVSVGIFEEYPKLLNQHLGEFHAYNELLIDIDITHDGTCTIIQTASLLVFVDCFNEAKQQNPDNIEKSFKTAIEKFKNIFQPEGTAIKYTDLITKAKEIANRLELYDSKIMFEPQMTENKTYHVPFELIQSGNLRWINNMTTERQKEEIDKIKTVILKYDLNDVKFKIRSDVKDIDIPSRANNIKEKDKKNLPNLNLQNKYRQYGKYNEI